jgi:hypothetical protein
VQRRAEVPSKEKGRPGAAFDVRPVTEPYSAAGSSLMAA